MTLSREIVEYVRSRGNVIHGARAVQRYVGENKIKTKDYDIYSKNPKTSAEELKGLLEKKYGKRFSVEPAIHKGTFKVKKGKKTIADFTKLRKNIPVTSSLSGVNYVKIGYTKRKLKRLIQEKGKEFRREKDRERLNKILLYETLNEKWI